MLIVGGYGLGGAYAYIFHFYCHIKRKFDLEGMWIARCMLKGPRDSVALRVHVCVFVHFHTTCNCDFVYDMLGLSMVFSCCVMFPCKAFMFPVC